ncbi:MAG: type II toxin-antitoxin system VapC family toxin [Treponema sp.]|jgi:predicted nucleic acid-binding protein|nr:type II toxin-antitoxin system VapC family toxin [Treponema sp.]
MTCVLDACALTAFLDRERGEGFEAVRDLFNRADAEGITIRMSIVNLIEVYYGCIRKYKSVEAADEIMRQVNELPIEVIKTVSDAVYRETARFKTRYSMSLADAFLCATAKNLAATLVTKDGEIRPAEQREKLSVFWIK